jgi:TolB-like protein
MPAGRLLISLLLATLVGACASASKDIYSDPNMDFGSVKNVAVLPFTNLSKDQQAGDRVRDVFITELLATGALYVIPVGEMARQFGVLVILNPFAPGTEEIVKLSKALKAQAVIIGVVREYGEFRSGSAAANGISMSIELYEGETGRIVWSASSTKGGVGLGERLLGGGGELMNDITVKAVDEIINGLLK